MNYFYMFLQNNILVADIRLPFINNDNNKLLILLFFSKALVILKILGYNIYKQVF